MMVLVTYDVATTTTAGRRRLRQVARACQNLGQRVQKSVFECVIEPAQWTRLKIQLLRIYAAEEDSLRFYFLGSNWRGRVEHHGAKPSLDPEEPLIV
jgi:CRISPR-associated protein Cas2